jgi:hypothetical protein
MPANDAVQSEFFEPPYPNRSSAGGALAVPGMKIEVVACVGASPPADRWEGGGHGPADVVWRAGGGGRGVG